MPEQIQTLTQEELGKLKDRGYTPRGLGFSKDNKFVSTEEIDTAVAEIRAEVAKEKERDLQIEVILDTLQTKVSMITRILARNAASVKEIENKLGEDEEEETGTDVEKESISALQGIKDSISSINGALVRINKALVESRNRDLAKAYSMEEASMEARPVDTTTPAAVKPERETGPSFGSLLKDFFTNPAVITAFSGLVYLFLPREIKEKVGSFFEGFFNSGDRTLSELSALEKALLGSAAGLATFFGAKFIASIADAVSTTISLIAKAGTTLKSLRKGGLKKAAGKLAKEAITSPKALGIGVATVTAGTALASESGEAPTPETKPSPSVTVGAEPLGTGIKPPPITPTMPSTGMEAPTFTPPKAPSGGIGIKPGGGIGIKEAPLPTLTGEDGPIMNMIKAHEGVRTRPYKDSLGLWTVGVGHLIGDGKSLPPEMNREFSMAEINEMFIKDYKHHKEAAEKIPGYTKLNNNGKAGLIDLTFNMGPVWYRKWPNFTRSISAGDTEGAAKSLEDSKWYTQVGRRAKTVVSLIKSGGERQPSTMVASAAMPERSNAIAGETINRTSESVESYSATSTPSIMTASVDNSRIKKGKEGIPPPPSIPSPIAVRDSLNIGNKHSTAYV